MNFPKEKREREGEECDISIALEKKFTFSVTDAIYGMLPSYAALCAEQAPFWIQQCRFSFLSRKNYEDLCLMRDLYFSLSYRERNDKRNRKEESLAVGKSLNTEE